MGSGDTPTDAITSNIVDAIERIRKGDTLAEAGDRKGAADEYYQAISILKDSRKKARPAVVKTIQKLLRCAYEHSRLLVNEQPVAEAQDIGEVVDEVDSEITSQHSEQAARTTTDHDTTTQTVRENIARGNRLRAAGHYGKAIESYQQASDLIDENRAGRSEQKLATEIDIYLEKARPKKERAERRIDKLDDLVQEINPDVFAEHRFDVPYQCAAVDSAHVETPADKVYTPPLNPEVVEPAIDYYRELGWVEQQLQSTSVKTGGATEITRQLTALIAATHPDGSTGIETGIDILRLIRDILKAYQSLLMAGDQDGLAELTSQVATVRSEMTTGEVDPSTVLIDRLERIKTSVTQRVKYAEAVVDVIDELNTVIQKVNHELLKRYGIELSYHGADVGTTQGEQHSKGAYRPPFEQSLVESIIDYYAELGSLADHFSAIETQGGGPTAVTNQLAAIVEATQSDVETNPQGAQKVVTAVCEVMDGYESLTEKDDKNGLRTLEDRLTSVRSDMKNDSAQEWQQVSARLADIKTWCDKRLRRVALQTWRAELRDQWPKTADEHLTLDMAVLEQLAGSRSDEPPLDAVEAGLQTAEQVIALASEVESVQAEYNVDRLEQVSESFGRYLRTHDITPDRVAQLKRTLAVIENACEAHQQYPTYPFAQLIDQLCDSLHTEPATPDSDMVRELLEDALHVLDFLETVDSSHPSIYANEWRETVRAGVRTLSQKQIQSIVTTIEKMGETLWEQDHLHQFSWEEFEHLIGSLYRARGYETHVTQAQNDEGVDVWATGDTERIAIQVKQYSKGSWVGRPEVQQILSTIVKGDADHAVVVTSSVFSDTAEEYAKEVGSEIELINGRELIQLLTESDIPPPVSGRD